MMDRIQQFVFVFYFGNTKTTSSLVCFYKAGKTNGCDYFIRMNRIFFVQEIIGCCLDAMSPQDADTIPFVEGNRRLIVVTCGLWYSEGFQISLENPIFARCSVNGIENTIELNFFSVDSNREIGFVDGKFFFPGG